MLRLHSITLTICLLCQLYISSQAQETAMLFDHGRYSLDYSDLENVRWQFERHYKIVVEGQTDVEILKNIIIETTNETKEKLIAADAWVHSAGDSAIHYALDSFKMQPFDAVWTEYLCQTEALETSDTLEVKYRIQADVSTELHQWILQYAYPVKESKVSFLIPESFQYADHVTDRTYLIREQALDSVHVIGKGFARAKIPQKGLELTFRDIPAYTEEPFAPALIESRPAFLLNLTEAFVGDKGGFLPPWAEQCADLATSDWFGKEYRVRSSYRWLSDAAESIMGINYSDELMILKLYEFIHQQFQWDGSFGLFPSYSIAEMRSQRTVNKASMNMALLALLNDAGFEAFPVLVATTDQRPVYAEIPSVNQFNHFVIEVQLDDKTMYVDAGLANLPPGWVDIGVRRDPAIRIKNYKGYWITLPEFASRSDIVIDMSVEDDFAASGSITASFAGYDGFNERNLLKEDPTGHYWKQRAAALSPAIRIDSVRYTHVKNLLEPFENHVFFHIEPSEDQSEFAINPVFYSFFNQQYFVDSMRTKPVHLPFKMDEMILLNLRLDDKLQIQTAPESRRFRLEGDHSTAQMLVSGEGNKHQYRFEVEFNKATFGIPEYGSLKAYLDQIYLLTRQYLVITEP